MYILGIESSCDDTSVALLKCSPQGHIIISEKTASQIDIHKKYGGVVPEIAGRLHAEKIIPLVEETLKKQPKPDAIAVTTGPGLVTGLLVGATAAQTLSYATNIPLVGVNHLEGHIHSVELAPEGALGEPIANFPAMALVVSGGHTELILMEDRGNYKILGSTKDDAAGECFDKVAKLLGLPYPGGPQISKLGRTGNPQAINFPRPMIEQENCDFSFSGLKTAALYWLRDHPVILSETKDPLTLPSKGILRSAQNDKIVTINDFCASVEQAIVDILIIKTLRAIENCRPKTTILAGGVAANQKLRKTLAQKMSSKYPLSAIRVPELAYCMDNGAMIAAAGYYHARNKKFTPWSELAVNPNWKINQNKN